MSFPQSTSAPLLSFNFSDTLSSSLFPGICSCSIWKAYHPCLTWPTSTHPSGFSYKCHFLREELPDCQTNLRFFIFPSIIIFFLAIFPYYHSSKFSTVYDFEFMFYSTSVSSTRLNIFNVLLMTEIMFFSWKPNVDIVDDTCQVLVYVPDQAVSYVLSEMNTKKEPLTSYVYHT